MLDLCLINPNGNLQSPLEAIEPPLWLGLIADYNTKKGKSVEIIDAEAGNLTIQQTVEAIRNINPKEVLIVVQGKNPSVSSTPKMPIAEALADRLRGLNVSLTGIHPIACGSKYPVIKRPFEGTPDLPFDKLPMNLYKAHNWHCLDGSPRSPYASIYTSLGCPYNCYYCNIHTLYPDHKMIYRPIPDILKEIDHLVFKYKVRNIKFWDELFALREDRVLEICEGLKEYDLNIWAYARVDTITKPMLKAMKKGGINWLAYGFESVADKKFIYKTEEVIKMTKSAGISIMGNFMFGAPGTTIDDDKQSVEFAEKHLFEFVNFYDAKPYPGSDWYNDTKPMGLDFNQYHNISQFRRDAFNDYFTNPHYITMIIKKWGIQAAIQIKEMLVARF
jgi:anaerobic magnesium-protoporphyrin IX monomethyl ester cyclase